MRSAGDAEMVLAARPQLGTEKETMVRLVFFGIHQIGVEALLRLLETDCRIKAVVTKPGTAEFPQLVEQTARRHGLTVHSPASPKDPQLLQSLMQIGPDLIAVAGYHRILPPELLAIPRLGAINLHTSLLPAYRGPVPWKFAIMHGLKETGVTVHKMVPKLDSGDILAVRKVLIAPDDTGGSLFARLSREGGELLAETVGELSGGGLKPVPQDDAVASYYSYPDEQQTRVDWTAAAETIFDLVRALDPSPGAWSLLNGQKIRLFGGHLGASRSGAKPGEIVGVLDRGVVVATAGRDLVVDRLAWDSENLAAGGIVPTKPQPGDVFQ